MSDLAPLTLDALRVGVMLLGPQDEVAYANPAADQLGLIEREPEGGAVAHSVLRSLAARTRRRNVPDDLELELPQGVGRDPLGVRVRLVALDDHVAIEAEDITAAHRLARVRRDFVANVSHELKTPVGALQLLSEALLEATDSIQEDESAVVRRFVERILHESTRMGRLVAELLELSRLEGGGPQPDPEPVALERVFLEVLDRTRTAAAARQITVRVDGRPQSQMRGNEGLLLTAVSNLVDNAIAYSPEGTTITISARQVNRDIEIAVADQGIGIAPSDQDRIFERFYRADPARSRATGGTGLGLAIVKHIATNHGGRVSVRSEVGKGSTFTMRLPSRVPEPGSTEPPGRSQPAARDLLSNRNAASPGQPGAAGDPRTPRRSGSEPVRPMPQDRAPRAQNRHVVK